MRDEATAVTAIGQVLQEQLDHGLLAPGSKLPAERKLSELFGTTRITVREALLQLEAQGRSTARSDGAGSSRRRAWPTT
jgi:DNA-binding FadR family transcriptional regulator